MRHSPPVGYAVSSGAVQPPAASRRRRAAGSISSDQAENSRTCAHSPIAAPASGPGLEDDEVDPPLGGVRGGGQTDGSGADDDQGVLHDGLLGRSDDIDGYRYSERLYRSPSINARYPSLMPSAPTIPLEDVTRIGPEQERRRELRGMVRRTGGPDQGAAAACGVDCLLAPHRRSRESARDQPVDLLAPRGAPAQGRIRQGRQGRHVEPRFGQRGVLHRTAARRRRGHGDPFDASVLPRRPTCRRHDAGPCRTPTCRGCSTSTKRGWPLATPPSRPRCRLRSGCARAGSRVGVGRRARGRGRGLDGREPGV